MLKGLRIKWSMVAVTLLVLLGMVGVFSPSVKATDTENIKITPSQMEMMIGKGYEITGLTVRREGQKDIKFEFELNGSDTTRTITIKVPEGYTIESATCIGETNSSFWKNDVKTPDLSCTVAKDGSSAKGIVSGEATLLDNYMYSSIELKVKNWNAAATVLSSGNVSIIIGMAAVAVIGVATLIVIQKKRSKTE